MNKHITCKGPKPNIATHTCKPRIWVVEAGGPDTLGHPLLSTEFKASFKDMSLALKNMKCLIHLNLPISQQCLSSVFTKLKKKKKKNAGLVISTHILSRRDNYRSQGRNPRLLEHHGNQVPKQMADVLKNHSRDTAQQNRRLKQWVLEVSPARQQDLHKQTNMQMKTVLHEAAP